MGRVYQGCHPRKRREETAVKEYATPSIAQVVLNMPRSARQATPGGGRTKNPRDSSESKIGHSHEKFPFRGPVDGPRPERHGGHVPSAGGAHGNRGAARRRHGGRCGGGGFGTARSDRAAIDRHWRRLLRADSAARRGQDRRL